MLLIKCQCYRQTAATSTRVFSHPDILLSILQCFPEGGGAEVKLGPLSDLAAGCCTGDCQPLRPGVT